MKYIPRCSSIIIQHNYRVLLGVRREAERVPAEAGALRRERAALADLVSGTGVNSALIDLGGLGEFCAAEIRR